MNDIVFIGTYSQRGSRGIYVYRRTRGALELLSTQDALNPTFLALSPDRRTLYAAVETGPVGAVGAYRIDPGSGRLEPLGVQSTDGDGPCHVAVAPNTSDPLGPGRWLVASHYGDGTHSVLPIRADGAVGPVASRITNAGTHGPANSQQHARAHSATVHPNGTIYACDLGVDRVIAYALDYRSGELTKSNGFDLPPGSGPRHLALHPTLPLAYVLNELSSTVAVAHLDTSRVGQVISTIPAGSDKTNVAADIHLRADARYLYASNRGHNSLAVYAVADDGALTALAHAPTGGVCPRNFAVLPGNTMLAANQESDNIVAFDIGDGLPRQTAVAATVPCPVCVLPLRATGSSVPQ